MTQSFRQFLSNRQTAPKPFGPQLPTRRRAADGIQRGYTPPPAGYSNAEMGISGSQPWYKARISKDVLQPNKNFEPFHESREYEKLQEQIAELNELRPTGTRSNAAGGGIPTVVEQSQQIGSQLEKEARDAYVKRVKQTDVFQGAGFKGLSGSDFNPDEEDPSQFIIREKSAHNQKIQAYNDSKPLSENISKSESEFQFYNQLLEKNNQRPIVVAPRIVNGEAVTDWEEKTTRAREQVMKMLNPIKVGGNETKILGYQKEALLEETAGARARRFAGKSANPLGEDFAPVVAAQAVFGGAARAATEPFERAGIISPETGSKIETGAAFTGEVVGFGLGIGSVARSARWMADDIMLPYKALRGAKNWVTTKYGQPGLRTSGQIAAAATDAGKAPVSAELGNSEITSNGIDPIEYAAQTVGSLSRPASDIRVVEEPNKPLKIVAAFRGEKNAGASTVHFTINSFDDYYQASGKILGMSDSQIAQAAKVSEPIIEGVAKLFGVTKDEYIKSLLPTVRSTYIGKDSVARTLTGGGIAGTNAGVMSSTFRRVASIIEYAKTNPDLVINEADAFISIQHELSHVILQDVFTYAKYGTTDGNVRFQGLSDSLKEQVLLRQQLTGEALTAEQLQAIKGLTADDVERLVNLDPVGTARESGKPLTWVDENQIRDLDLTSLLHESGSELFSRYLMEVARGNRPASSITQGNTGTYELDKVWGPATESLTDSWHTFIDEHLFRGSQPLGVARQQTLAEQTTLRKFAQILEDIAKQGTPSSGSIKAVKEAAIEKRRLLTEAEANDVAIILARATTSDDFEARMLATFFLNSKHNAIAASVNSLTWDMGRLGVLTDTELLIKSNSELSAFGLDVVNDPFYAPILPLLKKGMTAPDIDAIIDSKKAMRRAIILRATSPETKNLALFDISRQTRQKLSIVDPDGNPISSIGNWRESNLNPIVKKRLENLAFTNENGEPIIFMTGVKVDYKADFRFAESQGMYNLLGNGKYGTDFDIAAWSYADQAGGRVQAYIPLIGPDEVISMELIGTADRLGARFIDEGLLNNTQLVTSKTSKIELNQRAVMVDLTSVARNGWKSPSIQELAGRKVDFSPVDIEKTFGTSAFSELYDDFAEQLDIFTREEVNKGSIDWEEFAVPLPEQRLGDAWNEVLPAGFTKEDIAEQLGVNPEEFIIARAAIRTLANKAESVLLEAKNAGTATEAQQKAADKLIAQDKAFDQLAAIDLQDINASIFDDILANAEQSNFTYASMQLTTNVHELANSMIKATTASWWQVVKSSSLNNIPVIGELDEVASKTDLVSYLVHRSRNREFVKDIQNTFKPENLALFNDKGTRAINNNANIGVGISKPTRGGRTQYSEKKANNLLNRLYTKTGVGALTEIGGANQGGAPHRVIVLVGSDSTIKSKVLFVATDAKATEPEKIFHRKKNPQGGNLDNLTDNAELELANTKHGRGLVEGNQQLIDLNTDVIQRAIDQKIIATTRAVESPARAVEERLDLLRKAVEGNVIPRQPNNPVPNLSPPKVNFPKYFGDGVAEPINARILEEVLGDTTGRFGRIDGNMTEEGEDYIATNLIPEIEKRINSEEFKVWRETTDAEISAARTKTVARSETAREARQASSDPVRGYEAEDQAVGGAMKSQADKSKSGYKPLRLHPMEVVALINYGERRLPNIKNAKLKTILRTFDRTTYRKAIQKLMGVETPFVGSPASTKLKTGTEPQRFVAGMSGTTQLDVAEVLTPSEVTLVWEALGLSAKGRDVPPRTKWQILRQLIIQAFNAPRALLLSIDYGAIFNQGGMLIGGAIKPVTTRRSLSLLAKGDVKAWASGPDTQWYQNIAKSSVGMFTAKNYDVQMKTITNDVNYSFINKHVFISDLNGPLAQREEAFLGNLFNSVGNVFPDVVKNNAFMQKTGSVLKRPLGVVAYPFKAGERFHNLYLNKMRYELLNDYYKTLQNSNVPEAAIHDYLASYGNFLNKATGRGSLPDNVAPALSTVLLAPRWMTSRFQVPFTVMQTFGKEAMQFKAVKFKETEKAGAALRKANAHAKKWDLPKSSVVKTDYGYVVNAGHRGAHTSKQMGADLARTFGVLGGITTLLVLNGFEIETDWRKSNFLKASKGRVNIDLTLGLGSVWRFMARAAYGVSGDRKEITSMGDEFDADVMRQIGNFTKAKLSPLGSSIVGGISNENFFGEEVTGREQFIPGQSTDIEDFYPLMIQQIMEASEQLDGGFAKTLLGIGAAAGLNVSIYADKNDLSQELAGVDYKELYGYEQKYINRMYYEGSEFQPSKYTQDVYDIELEQYQKIETIMAGGQSKGDKAKSIYSLMNRYDAELAGVRRHAFDDSNEFDVPEGQPLKQAQNEYYEYLDRLYAPENEMGLSGEEIGDKLDSYLAALSPDKRDYIIANKSNFMVPDSLFSLAKVSAAMEMEKAKLRKEYQARGERVPAVLKKADGLYAVAQRVVDSNEARARLSKGRDLQVPAPAEQIQLTEAIATR